MVRPDRLGAGIGRNGFPWMPPTSALACCTTCEREDPAVRRLRRALGETLAGGRGRGQPTAGSRCGAAILGTGLFWRVQLLQRIEAEDISIFIPIR